MLFACRVEMTQRAKKANSAFLLGQLSWNSLLNSSFTACLAAASAAVVSVREAK
jgi:hypothetical protein